jgi:5-formyltetrahydrofolate cyclo-ligase
MEQHKSAVREKVWRELRKVAFPDSRFDYDFGEFIADFEGSSEALAQLTQLPCYRSACIIFITPDNCLDELRLHALRDGKLILMTTYAIRRGFRLLDPSKIAPSRYEFAATLDGAEKVTRPITLLELIDEKMSIELMVTGTGAINLKGVRFGKGHGFFDLEWAMLYTIGAISTKTHTAAIVHECQVLDEPLTPEEFDTVCDVMATPSRVMKVPEVKKPVCGILWHRLAPGMLESIPPLRELKQLIESGTIKQPEL